VWKNRTLNKDETIEHKSPIELVESIKLNNIEINDLMDEIEAILIKGNA
jgi:type I restriction enzyme M protein